MSPEVSHHGGWIRWPASTSTNSKMTETSARAAHRVIAERVIAERGMLGCGAADWLVAMAKSIASAALMHNSQRKGSCTKRNFGKYSQSRLLAGSITKAAPVPQAADSAHAFVPNRVFSNRAFPNRAGREYQTATTSTTISATANTETSRLKRL